MSSSDAGKSGAATAAAFETAANTLFDAAERALTDETTDAISDESIQKILTAASKVYARKLELEERIFLPVISRQAVTATEVVQTACELMRAADLNPFDLAMWYSRPRPEGAP